jgi:acyl carrier protein
MEIEAIERELTQFLEKNILTENVKITSDQELKAAGLDSFSIVEIILFIERKFGFVIPDEQLLPENFKTIQAIALLVHTYLTN